MQKRDKIFTPESVLQQVHSRKITNLFVDGSRINCFKVPDEALCQRARSEKSIKQEEAGLIECS